MNRIEGQTKFPSLLPQLCRPVDQSGKAPRVLCVDNNLGFLVSFTAALAMSGYVVFATRDPLEGLELVRKVSLSLALLDYELPAMNRGGLAREIRRAKPTLPIVLCSGSNVVPGGALKFVDHFLSKDITPKRLLQKIRRWTNSKRYVA